jgi:predicted transcriptional regulator
MNNSTEHLDKAARTTVTFHTSPATKARLDKLAKATERSKSFLTNAAVERYLADEEAFIIAVEQGLAEANAGKLIDHDKASKYLRSLGTKKPQSIPKPTRA